MRRKIMMGAILLLFLFPFLGVNASEISSIDMNIHIDKNGNASVTETWNAVVTDGTEGYHPYYDIGDSKLSDLVVSMDGRIFETINNWNINGSFNDKSYKAGIYYNGSNNEYDLCFGISNYGKHIYVMKYKIEGFVVRLNDADMVYWTLFPKKFSLSPGNVNITITSDVNIENSLPVWGFGKYGVPTYVKDSKIIMSTNGKKISSNEYLVLLVKFPTNSFNTNIIINKDFDYYLKMAKKNSLSVGLFKYVIVFSSIGIIILLVIFIYKSKPRARVVSYKLSNLDFGNNYKINKNDIIPYRDIPFNGDIFKAFWLIHFYDIANKDENILSAFLLKWINNDCVKLEKNNGKIESIVFSDGSTITNELEKKLYSFFRVASIANSENGNEFKLEVSEFEKWCSLNGHLISDWFCDVLEKEMDVFIQEKKIIVNKTPNGSSYSLKYTVDSSLKSDAVIVAGLKKFLEEFTIINERQPMEVKLFNDYLVYASMFGIADEVAKKFKEFYPEFITTTNFDFDSFYFISDIVTNDITFSSGNDMGNSGGFDSLIMDAFDYSAGGGGFSSGGGGGGSFGGGSGGGGFR